MRSEPVAGLPVYVVHTPALRERRAFLESALAELGWRAHWVVAPTVGALGRIRSGAALRLTRGEVEVYGKHVAALRAIAAGPDRALVLEDDAVFPPDFSPTWSRYLECVPADADVVFFGASCGLEAAPLADSPLYGAEGRTRSMSGYLITPSVARTLADRLAAERPRAPVDHAVNRLLPETGLRVYWSRPPLIENGSESGRYPRTLGRAPSLSALRALVRRVLDGRTRK